MTDFTPDPSLNALPPQNIEAEEIILGGILFDPNAMGKIIDILPTEAFYVQAHRHIYEAAKHLYFQNSPIDLMTVATWLNDNKLLDQIGSTAKLANLVDRTVTAVNVERYVPLVMEKYLRRLLISAGRDIIDLAFDSTKQLDTIIDEVEQKIFNLTQSRIQQGLIAISDTLTNTFTEIEKLHQKLVLPGISCGFYDLDGLTSGFQRSDLIIIAGRPAMGKTSFALNIAVNIAKKEDLTVAIFSLEMSREQLAMRLLSGESKIESNKLRSGRITENEMEPLAKAVGNLSSLPIYIDDTGNLSVMQMRSEVRRLQAEKKGNLGLVLLDYLQLMEGSSQNNRVQELSKITRSLKSLAREINVPIIALSQLSRGVEQRTSKRPMLSDLRESGCLTGDTLIPIANLNEEIPLKNLINCTNFAIFALNLNTGKLEKGMVSNVFSTGRKPVFCLTTRSGFKIRATKNHKFLTLKGWKKLEQILIKEKLAVPKKIKIDHQQQSQKSNNLSSLSSFPKNSWNSQFTTMPDSNLNPQKRCYQSQLTTKPISQSDIYWDEVTSIDFDGIEEVFDLTVPYFHNFVANNIIVHNSIEQDADLVLMLYRDEYYNPESIDQGVAEVIIAKHRNGPTGQAKLIFKPELTQFLNMQKRDY